MFSRLINTLLGIILCVTVNACIGGEVGYKAGPLEITVNTFGEIEFAVKPGWEIPTPLGVFSVGVIADPQKYFKAKETLTIRFNCEDHIYDLGKQNFSVDFKPGYYEKVSLQKTKGNILLELRLPESGSAMVCATPTASAMSVNQSGNDKLSNIDSYLVELPNILKLVNIQSSSTSWDRHIATRDVVVTNDSDWPIEMIAVVLGEDPNYYTRTDTVFTENYYKWHNKCLGPEASVGDWPFLPETEKLKEFNYPYRQWGQDSHSTATYSCKQFLQSQDDNDTRAYGRICIVFYPLSHFSYGAFYSVYLEWGGSDYKGTFPILTSCNK